MEMNEQRNLILDQIFENISNLTKEDLEAISNFSKSISKINSDDKKKDEDAIYLLNFFKHEDPIPADEGQAAINLFNDQKFGYLQKRFKIIPDLINFLIKEKNDIIDVFFLQREGENGMPTLDIAYKNSSDGKYYCLDNERGGVEMTDFFVRQAYFENNCKKKLDIGQNPNGYACPDKIMINKSHFLDFMNFQTGKINPKIYLATAINLDRTENDFYKRITLVMNFGHDKNGVNHPDMNSYFDTYHLCPPGTC